MIRIKIGLIIVASLLTISNIPAIETAPYEITLSTLSPVEVAPAPAPAPVEVATAPVYNVALSKELQRYTYDLCVEYSIEEYYALVLAVMWHESVFDAKVISQTNDYGLMQINKINHALLSEKLGITDFLNEKQNIEAGIYILSNLILKYEDVDKALMAYNMGESGAKRRWADGVYTTTYTTRVRERLAQVLTGESH